MSALLGIFLSSRFRYLLLLRDNCPLYRRKLHDCHSSTVESDTADRRCTCCERPSVCSPPLCLVAPLPRVCSANRLKRPRSPLYSMFSSATFSHLIFATCLIGLGFTQYGKFPFDTFFLRRHTIARNALTNSTDLGHLWCHEGEKILYSPTQCPAQTLECFKFTCESGDSEFLHQTNASRNYSIFPTFSLTHLTHVAPTKRETDTLSEVAQAVHHNQQQLWLFTGALIVLTPETVLQFPSETILH